MYIAYIFYFTVPEIFSEKQKISDKYTVICENKIAYQQVHNPAIDY